MNNAFQANNFLNEEECSVEGTPSENLQCVVRFRGVAAAHNRLPTGAKIGAFGANGPIFAVDGGLLGIASGLQAILLKTTQC